MSTLKVGTNLHPDHVARLGLAGTWSVWSQAPGPGCFWITPVGSPADGCGVKHALVKAVMGATAARASVELVRTDPPRQDLLDRQMKLRNTDKKPTTHRRNAS